MSVRIGDVAPDFTAETLALAEADSFETIAAGLERLASVVQRSFQPPLPQPPSAGEPAPSRQAA